MTTSLRLFYRLNHGLCVLRHIPSLTTFLLFWWNWRGHGKNGHCTPLTTLLFIYIPRITIEPFEPPLALNNWDGIFWKYFLKPSLNRWESGIRCNIAIPRLENVERNYMDIRQYRRCLQVDISDIPSSRDFPGKTAIDQQHLLKNRMCFRRFS